jgi:Helicase conserved C-terminal domain
MIPAQQEIYEKTRADMASKADESSDIHIFRALDIMGKASIDLALIDPVLYKDASSPLIDACVDAATLEFQATGGGQIIFCDHIQVHEKIKAELVKRGVSPDRIVIMNASTVPRSEDRYRASEDFNQGKFDFVIGNPPVIGEAVNLQHNAGGSHVLGVPWEPEALKQMRGRARRQGNQREVVHEHIYFDRGGCSAYRFQILEGKNDWSQVLWSGEKQAENPARTGGFSPMELLIMLAPDPVAARQKYEADIHAAEERHAMVARRRAYDDFRRLQEMQASLRTISDETRANDTGQRLIRSEEVMRDKLLHNQNFGPKRALENATASLYFPDKDTVLTIGDMIVRTPKDTGYSEPFAEAVTEIYWKKQSITLARTNELKARNDPYPYQEIEQKMNSGNLKMAPEGTPSREEIIAQALREPPDGFKSIGLESLSALRNFPDDWLVENQAGLTRHAIHCAEKYRLNFRG